MRYVILIITRTGVWGIKKKSESPSIKYTVCVRIDTLSFIISFEP